MTGPRLAKPKDTNVKRVILAAVPTCGIGYGDLVRRAAERLAIDDPEARAFIDRLVDAGDLGKRAKGKGHQITLAVKG